MVSILSLHILGILEGRKQIITLVFLYIDNSQILKGNLHPIPSCHTPRKCMYLSHCRSLWTNKTLWIKKTWLLESLYKKKGCKCPVRQANFHMPPPPPPPKRFTSDKHWSNTDGYRIQIAIWNADAVRVIVIPTRHLIGYQWNVWPMRATS